MTKHWRSCTSSSVLGCVNCKSIPNIINLKQFKISNKYNAIDDVVDEYLEIFYCKIKHGFIFKHVCDLVSYRDGWFRLTTGWCSSAELCASE